MPYKKNPDVVCRKVAGETILMPIRSKAADFDSIYTLNELGTRIWEILDRETVVPGVLKALQDEFEGDPAAMKKDLKGFLSRLKCNELIRES